MTSSATPFFERLKAGITTKEQSTALPAPLFHHGELVARARDAVRPGGIEIGDEPLEAFRCERSVKPRHIGKLIGGVVHARIRGAPEAPAFLRFELGQCHRQMVRRIPVIEFFAQPFFDHGADDKISFGHGVVLLNFLPRAAISKDTSPLRGRSIRAADREGVLFFIYALTQPLPSLPSPQGGGENLSRAARGTKVLFPPP